MYANFNPLYCLKSFVEFPVITLARPPYWFQCYTKQHLPLTPRKKCTPDVQLNSTTLNSIYKCTRCTPFWKIKCAHGALIWKANLVFKKKRLVSESNTVLLLYYKI